MGVWNNHVVPRIVDVALGSNEVRTYRERVAVGLHGTVLEIGFGSGLNLPVYPPEVETVLAVDPSGLGRQLAARRVAASPVRVEFIGLDGQEIPLENASVDAALSTFTLCTIPDASRALGEVRRVLKPGGRFHFLEHGLSPDPEVARWQHRCNALEQRVAGGCNINRPVDDLVRDAGFELSDLHKGYMRGPKMSRPWGYLYEGRAVPVPS